MSVTDCVEDRIACVGDMLRHPCRSWDNFLPWYTNSLPLLINHNMRRTVLCQSFVPVFAVPPQTPLSLFAYCRGGHRIELCASDGAGAHQIELVCIRWSWCASDGTSVHQGAGEHQMELVQGYASDGVATGVGIRWSWYRGGHQMELIQGWA